MSDYDIHSCGYYCDRHACIVAQRNELRDKLFEEIRTSERNAQTSDTKPAESSQPWVKTYSGGKPNYTQPIEPEPMIDGWPLYSGLPPQEEQGLTATPLPAIKLKDERVIDKSMAKRIATQLGWEPKREWVGLTHEEIDAAVKSCNTTDTYKYFRAIEAKLKEKNYD